MSKSTRTFSTLLATAACVLLLANTAFAGPNKPPLNKKMDQNNDHKIDQKEKIKGTKVWNQNNNQGPNNKFNVKNGGSNCNPGDQKCIKKVKMQGQQQNCHPKDVKCIERHKKFKKSQVNKPWEAHADTNNDGHVGKVEATKAKKDLNYKKDMLDGTLDGPSSPGSTTDSSSSSGSSSTSTP